jgi:hypothetical protein
MAITESEISERVVRITESELLELEARYGRIAHIKGEDDAWEIVLRKPTRAEYKIFRGMLHDEARKSDAVEMMFWKMCVVPADKQMLDALVNDYPAIPEACAGKILKLAGTGVEVELKK